MDIEITITLQATTADVDTIIKDLEKKYTISSLDVRAITSKTQGV